MTEAFDTILAFIILGMALRVGWGIGTAIFDTARDVREARADQQEL
ncbi:hypothetical protein ACFSDD_09035 [Salipiger marinus]|nr:hypothetical protein [Salipiger manganoxidans]MEB3421917.1 hypothetical protein [Salipiger manganoxidans]